MATVNLTEIKGSDGISGSRNRINSNIKILGNWINGYVDVFKIDKNNGILDLSSTTTGKIVAKRGEFNSIKISTSGASGGASINSSGVGSFVALNTQILGVSGQSNLAGLVNIKDNAVFDIGSVADFDGKVNMNGHLKLGPKASISNTSTVISTGLTAGAKFPDSSSGGGGFNSLTGPYEITGQENIIYADLSSPGGFMMSVGDGIKEAALPEGFELTIINTNRNGGSIATGIQNTFYTGFNTNALQGGWGTGITTPANNAYRSVIKLRWEPRVDKDSVDQKGSWVLLSSTNFTI